MRIVRIFVSSPFDVSPERRRIEHVIGKLNAEFGQFAQLQAVRWENHHYGAHESFQTQIPAAADCDIVIGILWSRIGSELPHDFVRAPDGEPYESGTAFEIRTAIERREQGASVPDIFVFRKTAAPQVRIDQPEAVTDARVQWDRLSAFFNKHFVSTDYRFLRAFNSFDTTDAFAAEIEKLLRAWVVDNLLGERRAVWNVDLQGSPFRGLAAFEAKHAKIYFGRDRKVARAIELLREAAEPRSGEHSIGEVGPDVARVRTPFLLIVGTSGSGKSSLMRAGISPRLTAPGIVSDTDVWRVAVMRPGAGGAPLADLAEALAVTGDGDDPGGFGPALPEIYANDVDSAAMAAALASEPEKATARIVAALEAIAALAPDIGRAQAPRARLLLLVDQMEEVFRADVSADERTAFLRALSLLTATGRIWAIATLRDDVYGRLISDRYGIALKDAGASYDLAPPGEAELEEILQRSAEAAAIQYERDTQTGETLDARLVREASGQDVLPLLQFSLNRLFEARERREDDIWLTHGAYDAMGGLDGAIDQAAEQALDRVPEAAKDRLPRLLRTLAGPLQNRGDAGDLAGLSVRATDYDALASDQRDAALAEALIEARILRVARSADGGGTLQIIHERVLSSWARARDVVAMQQDFYRIRDDVEARRRHWERDRKRSDRLLSPGKPLADAESIATTYRDELTEESLTFIKASSRRARFRQSLIASAALLFACTTILAGAMGFVAERAGQRAQRNYEAAQNFGDGMIETTAETLGEVSGISVTTLDVILGRIQAYFGVLEESNPTTDLVRSRGALLVAFSQTYKRTGNLDQALALAEESRSILRGLLAETPDDTEAKWRLSQALELIGDVKRERAKANDGEDQAALRRAAHEAFDESLVLRRSLADLDGGNKEWSIGLAQILTRLGDLEHETGNETGARSRYREVLAATAVAYRVNTRDPELISQLGWAFNKIGDVHVDEDDDEAALSAYQSALCLRREAAGLAQDQWRVRLDVSWTLSRIANVLIARNDLSAADPVVVEAMMIRHDVFDLDQRNARVLRDLLLVMQTLADLRLRRDAPTSALDYALEAQRLSAEFLGEDREAEGVERVLAALQRTADAARARIQADGLAVDEAGAEGRVLRERDRLEAAAGERPDDGAAQRLACQAGLNAALSELES